MRICRRGFNAGLLGTMAGSLLHSITRPKLLVMVVLEQFRPDYLESVSSQLSPGGFRRLAGGKHRGAHGDLYAAGAAEMDDFAGT